MNVKIDILLHKIIKTKYKSYFTYTVQWAATVLDLAVAAAGAVAVGVGRVLLLKIK